MILFSHPTGNANVRNAALSLRQAKLLLEFHTTYCHQKSLLSSALVPQSIQRSLARRSFPEELLELIHPHPVKELSRHFFSKLGLASLTKNTFSVDSVYQSLDRACSKRLDNIHDRITATYCYEDGAVETFSTAKKHNKKRLYDLPIGYWRAAREIMLEEAERKPEWAMTIPGNRDSDQKLARKDKEIELADHIFVASSFTKKTLDLCPTLNAPISVIPYGAPASSSYSERKESYSKPDKPLKVLFVGSLSQRKGLSYLFQSAQDLGKSIEFTIIGQMPALECPTLERELAKHRYLPSLPHDKILEEMKAHDVFVFPSLFEGFGLVLVEAMSQGLPIITTAHTAGPDLIKNGEEGFIIPIRSSESITESLSLLGRDRELLKSMGNAAVNRSRNIKWETYRSELGKACKQITNSQ